MKIILLIGAGSFVGGILRYLLALFIDSKLFSPIPLGIFIVNFTGCLLIGILIGLSEKFRIAPELQLIIATGVLGGFTTFSAFSLGTIEMLRNEQWLYSFLYIIVTVFVCLLSSYLGLVMVKQ
jgi:CrcB protein